MAEGEERPASTNHVGRSPKLFTGFRRVIAIVSGIVTLATAGTLLLSAIGKFSEQDPPTESQLFAKLRAGMTYSRFRATLGKEPDARGEVAQAPDGAFLKRKKPRRFVFIRPDAYLQAVVTGGTVAAFSITTRSKRMHPSYKWPTARGSITLGRSRFQQESPDRVGGFCGANRAQYFEAYGGSNADNAQEFALGASSIGLRGGSAFTSICAADGQLAACDANESYANVIFHDNAADCFLRTKPASRLRSITVNTYVETAPGVRLFSESLVPLEPEVARIGPGG